MKQRFFALDGMRGICALLVLVFHTFVRAPHNPVPYGYLSVDVFFIISGFVIAFAFRDKLASGLGLLEFLGARARRLGPVHLFATLLCAAVFLLAGFDHYPIADVARAAALNLFLVPSAGGGHFAFPLNPPTWSLFVEFWVNVGFALLAARLTRRFLIVIVAVGWTLSAFVAWHFGAMGFGTTGDYVFHALPRGAAAFACGVLIFDLWRSGALAWVPSVNPLLVFGGFVAMSALPIPGWHGLHDIVVATLVAPAAIVLLARNESPVPAWAKWLGRISYPLYASHFVIVYAATKLATSPVVAEFAALTISLALAEAITRWFEPAVRGIIARRSGSLALAQPQRPPALVPAEALHS